MIRNVILDWSGTLVDDLESVSLLPHAQSFLCFCRTSGRRLFLLSTMRADHFEVQARRLGIRNFFEQVDLGAADKASQLVALLRAHRLSPEETVSIGAMVHDVEAAKAAGVLSAAVSTGFGAVETLAFAKPDLLLRDLGVLQRFWEPSQTRGEWIEIVDLEVSTRIGVPAAERSAPQKLWLDLSFQVGLPFSGLGDEVEQTVDYAAVAAAVTDFASHHECRLMETFASRVTGLIERRFSVRNVCVTVKKVILPQTRCVRVRTGQEPA